MLETFNPAYAGRYMKIMARISEIVKAESEKPANVIRLARVQNGFVRVYNTYDIFKSFNILSKINIALRRLNIVK